MKKNLYTKASFAWNVEWYLPNLDKIWKKPPKNQKEREKLKLLVRKILYKNSERKLETVKESATEIKSIIYSIGHCCMVKNFSSNYY